MGNGFQQGRNRSNAGSLLESARLLTSNAAELVECVKTYRAHIAGIRIEIEQIRDGAARARRGDWGALPARGEEHADAVSEPRADPSSRDPHDPKGRAVIVTALLVVFIGIIGRASRRQS
ncbi:hypothetical protein [Nevskia ramosa]|uniref:hypothetical protein n=1 Tax=Nevskia ramosa TaxID=64002 RepID=UPI0003B30FFE|nr:hypothetical protein [Nevskia ramosa]